MFTELVPEPAPDSLPDGTLLLGDEFRIIGRLGAGGFGITYLATDVYLDRSVVIKECYPEAFCARSGKTVSVRSQDNIDKYRSIVKMFMREARAIAKLRHPNIIGVHRVFEDNRTAYLALDLIDGQDLQALVAAKSPLITPERVQDMLAKVLDAVQLIHDQDLLHRDISPDNILLDKWGSPVLIDFGAAREEASRETRAISAVMVVKDGYSPQEFYTAGTKQTPASDLYALAATFYYVIAGAPPVNSQNRLADIAEGKPDPCIPLEGRFPEYPDVFLRAIDVAMSVIPKDRLQSAKEWLDMVRPVQLEQPVIRPQSKVDKLLNAAVSDLVTQTNEHLRLVEAREAARVDRPQTIIPRRKLSVPKWAEEFNTELAPKKLKKEYERTKRDQDSGPHALDDAPEVEEAGLTIRVTTFLAAVMSVAAAVVLTGV